MEIIRKGVGAIVFRFSGILLSYAFTAIVTRQHGIEAWGVVAIAYSLIQIISRFSRLGLDRAALKFIAEHRERDEKSAIGSTYSKAFSLLAPSTLVAGILFALVMDLLGPETAPSLFEYRWHLAFSIPLFSMLYLNIWALRALKKIKEYVILENTSIFLCSLAFLFLFQNLSQGSDYSLIAFLLSIALTTVFSFIVWAKHGQIALSLKESVSFKALFKVSIPLLITSSLYLLMGQIDTLMIAGYLGEEQVGVYNIFTKVVRLTAIGVTGVESIFLPKISKFYVNKNWIGLERIALKSNLLVVITSIVVLVVLITFHRPIIKLFGDESQLLFAAMSTFYWLLAARFMHAILGNGPFILNMTDHQKVMTKIAIAATLLNIGLNALLIPVFEIQGAAIASLSSLLVFNIGAIVQVKRIHNIKTSILQQVIPI